jgi:hypothetical protein
MSRTPDLFLIDGRKVQVTLKDEPEYAADVVEHTVERGSNIADSVKPKLVTQDLEGVVSDVKGASDGTLDPQAFDAFMVDLVTSRRAVTLFGPRWQFTSMVCTSYKPKRRGSALAFSSKWKEFRVVNSRLQVVKVVLGAKAKKGPVQAETIEAKVDSSFAADQILGPSSSPTTTATKKELEAFGIHGVGPAAAPSSAPAPTLTSPFAGRSSAGSAHQQAVQ